MQNGMKLIAIGLALSYEDRKQRITMLNDSIDAITDAIRSSSNVDGLPRGTGVTDPVTNRLIRVQAIEAERDAEQDRVNAVDWAEEYVRAIFKEEDGDKLMAALELYLQKKKKEAHILLSETSITESSFHYARQTYMNQILHYLHYI